MVGLLAARHVVTASVANAPRSAAEHAARARGRHTQAAHL
ncbi:hypothetical protein XFF6992_460129 [Xanthomonas citri pv. fuscans]|uniref:Uncharacterized protein n=1 Tax=Xanthomonas campestris pv. phaseoli TaxID=317013 RepID=A0A7Z7IZ55_XANCH|nr:hypothetical protein XFF6990_440110 [Xanthomonas citri pv. fuscans]SOO20499.1 hypothetical protein XFF6992_460129 [Xanthomonas citri pv. fuscans]SOO24278.1 hypothetical protein XFF6991_340077 [Xanthomonas phaseoli pv. phaseoli]SOO34721.1 hypothetical protein XFF6994_4550002 [Xanthomonas citri pv. fuscans]